MLKYCEVQIGFSEIPDKISLLINISGCPFKCEGCHSPHLRGDIGDPLDVETVKKLIENNKGINCIVFMGGDKNPLELVSIAREIKKLYSNLSLGWYSGIEIENIFIMPVEVFDYIKAGPYIEKLGPINKEGSNQILLKHLSGDDWENITYKLKDDYNKSQINK